MDELSFGFGLIGRFFYLVMGCKEYERGCEGKRRVHVSVLVMS